MIDAGFFPKHIAPRPDWIRAPQVDEIASVSECISPGPRDWVEAWKHNELGFYDSPALAWDVVPAGAEGFEVVAFSVEPARYVKGGKVAWTPPELRVEPRPAAYASIGFDVVSKSFAAFCECSPLSCCNLAAEIPTNRFCLVDSLDTARALALRFSREEPEPGDYYIVQVWRCDEKARHLSQAGAGGT